ncbi:hypothetical protein [Novosphingobium capsulatum]|nr:hypothetical protein U0041_13565 [Novosphingobium capsulatum]
MFATETERLIADLTEFLAGRRPDDRQAAIDAVTAQMLITPNV